MFPDIVSKSVVGRKLWTPDLRSQEFIVGADEIDLSKEILVAHSDGKIEGEDMRVFEPQPLLWTN